MAKLDYTKNFTGFYQDVFCVEGDYGPRPMVPGFLKTWLDVAFPLPEGDPMARNIMDLRSKKQGKSALAAAVALYMASRKPYSEVVVVAADRDQAKDRVLRAIKYAVTNGPLSDNVRVFKDVLELENNSIIQAVAQDWQGAAGGNYSAVIFDELHAWVYENQRRVFDEMVIPPTQKTGVRWVSTYAGFEGESLLLKEWWELAEKGKRINKDLPIFHNEKASLLAFIDTGEASWRMPWMTAEYIEQIRTTERPNTFRRLWLNEWVNSESRFLPEGAWEDCYSEEVRPLLSGDKRKIVVGADASTSRDFTSLVGVEYNPETKTADQVFIRVWKPVKIAGIRLGKPTIDIEETIGEEVIRLFKAGQLFGVVADPYQLHTSILKWQRLGIKVIELPQTTGRVESDQALYDSVIGKTLRHYNDPILTEHIQNAVAVETPRGLRLAKERTSRKIDAAVALSMALHGALNYQSRYSGYPMVIKDPFAIWPIDGDLLDYDPVWGFTEKGSVNHEPHPPGVTWQNCKKRNKGCDACVAELEAIGEFENQRLEKEWIESGAHGKHQQQGPTPFEIQQAEIAMKKHRTIELFKKLD